MMTTNSRWFQIFRMKGAFLTVEKENKVADVQSGLDNENRSVLMYKKHGKINQQWDIVYVSDWSEPKKGEMNEDFGFKVDTDFFIESQMGENRFIDLVGSNLVIKTRNGLPSQEWFFDGKTKTIKSTRTKSYSWDIQNAGRSSNMQAYNTNADTTQAQVPAPGHSCSAPKSLWVRKDR